MAIGTIVARIACAVCVLALSVDGVRADEAYWHGVRSDNWNQGVDASGVLSNWYSEAPPNGVALKVPDGTAIFAEGALRTNLRITRDTAIGRIRFEADAPLYTFRLVRGKKLIISRSVVNQSATVTPRFALLGGAIMEIHGESRFVSAGAASSASIETFDDGELAFLHNSRGGDATVVNNQSGDVYFTDDASAERMTITNRGQMQFEKRSSGDRAHLINEQGGRIFFTSPTGYRDVPVGKVDNDGTVDIETQKLLVSQRFSQTTDGSLVVAVASAGAGGLVVTGLARLDGALSVHAFTGANPGVYKIVQAAGGRRGKFASLDFQGPDDLEARLAYSGTEVNLIVRRK